MLKSFSEFLKDNPKFSIALLVMGAAGSYMFSSNTRKSSKLKNKLEDEREKVSQELDTTISELKEK